MRLPRGLQADADPPHTHTHTNRSPCRRYVLLRGRKRFRLYPPSMAYRMCTVGRVAKVHPNGRIVFEGQVSGLPTCRKRGDRGSAASRAQGGAAEEGAVMLCTVLLCRLFG